MNEQLILVPRISSLPAHEGRAQLMLRWLVKREIVAALPSTCGALGNGMAHAIGVGARQIAERPELLPFDQPLNGLQIVSKRCIYTPTEDFHEEAGCPECRREVGEALFESLDEWMPGDTDNFTCPLCGFEDDVNGFLFLQPCAFSNLGFVFNGWGRAGLRQGFLDEFAERLGYPLAQVAVRR